MPPESHLMLAAVPRVIQTDAAELIGNHFQTLEHFPSCAIVSVRWRVDNGDSSESAKLSPIAHRVVLDCKTGMRVFRRLDFIAI